MVKVTLLNHENIQWHTRHLYLRHRRLALTVTWLLLTAKLLLTASLEEVWIPAGASGHRPQGRSGEERARTITPFSALKPLKQPPREGKSRDRGPFLLDCLCHSKWEASLPGLAPERVIKVFPLPPLSWGSVRHCHLSIFLPIISAMLKWVHGPLFSLVSSAINSCLKCEAILAPPSVN